MPFIITSQGIQLDQQFATPSVAVPPGAVLLFADAEGRCSAKMPNGNVLPLGTVGRRTLYIDGRSFSSRMTGGPGPVKWETATNKVNLQGIGFDAAVQEYAQASIAFPKSWDRGALTFQVHWTAASGSGGVAWGLSAVAVSAGESLDAAFGAEVVVTDTLTATNCEELTAESTALTVAGNPALGDMVIFQLSRVVTNASDTLAADAVPLGVSLFYTMNAGNDT